MKNFINLTTPSIRVVAGAGLLISLVFAAVILLPENAQGTDSSKGSALTAQKYTDRTEVQRGETINYSIRIKNSGNKLLHNVLVVDYLPNKDNLLVDYVAGSGKATISSSTFPLPDTWVAQGAKIAYLNPGQELVIQYQVKVRNSVTNGQILWNVANVKSDETPAWLQCSVKTTVVVPPPPTLVCAPGTQTHNINETASLSVAGGTGSYSWSAVGGSPSSGSGSSFSTQYGSSGDKDVKVTSGSQEATCKVHVNTPPPPPPPPTLVCAPGTQTHNINETASLSVAGGTGSYSWSAVGGSPSSGSGSSFSTQYGSSGEKQVSVVSGSQTATCTVFVNTPPPPSVPRLTIDKIVAESFTTPGSTVHYTVIVTNAGLGQAQNVILTDVLPSDFNYSDNLSATTRDWTIGNLNSGESRTISYNAVVKSTASLGAHVNTATVRANNHGSVSDTAVVDVRNPTVQGETDLPQLYLKKTSNVAVVNPGGIVVYSISLENRGRVVAQNVIVVDTLPAGFTTESGGQQSVTWNIGDLAPGARWDMTIRAKVGTNVAAGSYRNVVTARANNHGQIEHFADVEVRIGQVLGISTLPSTGSPLEVAAQALGAMASASVAGYWFLRRRNRSAEDMLKSLVTRLR